MENLDENNHDQGNANDSLSKMAKENLHKSAGWVKAVAILSIIGAGLGAIGSLFVLFMQPVMGIFALIITGVSIYIAILLLNVANSADRGTFDMDKFALNFLKYWKTAVIFGIVAVVLNIIVSVVVGGTMSSQMFPTDF